MIGGLSPEVKARSSTWRVGENQEVCFREDPFKRVIGISGYKYPYVGMHRVKGQADLVSSSDPPSTIILGSVQGSHPI